MTALPCIDSIYTDGACSGNPGPGGWGVVVYFQGGAVAELGGAAAQTTNNRMELQAAIAALAYWQDYGGDRQPFTLYTDSEYVKNGITKWIKGWKKKGWQTSTGKPVLNQDLWEELDQLNTTAVQWQYVRGHAGNAGNERCDVIARAFSLGKTPILKQVEVTPAIATAAVADRPPSSDGLNTDIIHPTTLESSPIKGTQDDDMTSSNASTGMSEGAGADSSSQEERVAHIRQRVEMLRMADEIASQGYLITSAELADLMDINASAVTSRGDNWVWRNWVVARVRREGNQILWQLDRVDQ